MIKNLIKGIFQKAKTFYHKHKFLSIVILLAFALFAYYVYGKVTSTSGETRYVLGIVEKKTVIASISGSGQVESSNQIDIKPKVSGEILWLGVTAGDSVGASQALMSIDNTDAKKAIVDAEQNLAEAKLQFTKDQAAAPFDYQKTLDTLATDKDNLATAYINTFTTISDAYLDLPAVMSGLDNILFGYDLSPSRSQWNVNALVNLFSNTDKDKVQILADKAQADYNSARSKYDSSLEIYKLSSRYSTGADLEKLLGQTIDTTTAVAQALQSELNLLAEVIDLSQLHKQNLSPLVTTMQTNGRNYLSTANSTLNGLLSQKKTIDTDKRAITIDQQNISLLEVGNSNGENPISLQISANNIATQEENLAQLKADLADYTVVAPFGGTVAVVNVKKFDTAGTGSAVATLITTQKIATLSVNEVDAAKIKVGNKATMTFDAIENLSLTGSVESVDPMGTVSQGVVSYSIKIVFDTQDTRVKPGMTVNASIITEAHLDVLSVPSGAVKTQNGVSYVSVFEPALLNTGGTQGVVSTIPPTQVEVQVGISDDTNVEILSGLSEGQQIVTRTISGSATAATTATTNTNRSGGLGGGIRL